LLGLVSGEPSKQMLDVAVRALTQLESPELVHRVLEASLSGTFPAHRRRQLYRGLFERPLSRDAARAWLEQHLDRLKTKVSEATLAQIFWILPELCQRDRVRAAVQLFEPRARGSSQLWGPLREARLTAERCGAVARHQAPLAKRWLLRRRSGPHD
jgi:hypothetical protein